MKRANRIASWVLAGAVVLLVVSEDCARQTWRERAVESQANLNQVRQFLALERAHVKKLCSLAELMAAQDAVRVAKEGQ